MNMDGGPAGDYELAGNMLAEHDKKDLQESVEVSGQIT